MKLRFAKMMGWLGLALLAFAGAALADSITYPSSGSYTTGWKQISFGDGLQPFLVVAQKFDPALGTLTKVDFTLTGVVDATVSAYNNSLGPLTSTVSESVRLVIFLPPDANQAAVAVTGPDIAQSMTIASHQSQSASTGGPVTSSMSTSTAPIVDGVSYQSITSQAALDKFIGTDPLYVPVEGVAYSGFTDNGNLQTSDVTHGQASFTITYTYTPKASISGKVYEQAGNTGLNGQTVTLTCTAGSCTLPTGCTTWTPCSQTTRNLGGVDGSYSFTGLAAGTYTLVETQPKNYGEGTITVPGGNGGASSVLGASGTSTVAGITVVAGTAYTNYNFGETLGTLSGRVCVGVDGTSECKHGEAGIAGVVVTLSGNVADNATSVCTVIGGANCSQTTAADGSYTFANLPRAGTGGYTVAEQAQTIAPLNAYRDGPVVKGASCGACATTSTSPNDIHGIPFDPDTLPAFTNYNFAELPSPSLSLTKDDHVTTVQAGGTTTYTLTVSNVGTAVTSGAITVVDVLPAGLSIGTGTVTLSGANAASWTCSAAAQVITCTSSAPAITAGGNSIFAFTVNVAVSATGSLTNPAQVGGGGDPLNPTAPTSTTAGQCIGTNAPNRGCAVDTDIVGAPASVSGHVWLNKTAGQTTYSAGNVIPLAGWKVQLLDASGNPVGQPVLTASDGSYSIPVAPGVAYKVEFINPATGTVWGGVQYNPQSDVCPNCKAAGTVINGVQTAGGNIPGLDLPIDPSGVIYDARTGAPVSGATVTVSAPGLTAADTAAGSLTYTTGADGGYQFFFLPSAPKGVTYTLSVTAPNYLPASPASASTIIPPCSNALNVSAGAGYPDPGKVQAATWSASRLSLPRQTACPADNSAASGFATGAATTLYYLSFAVQAGGWSNIMDNHIPLDPLGGGSIFMTKTTPLVNVARGDLVPYTLTATNTLAAALTAYNVVDEIPPGFKYRSGSGQVDGVAAEPAVSGRILTWPGLNFGATGSATAKKTFKLILMVGSGVGDGIYINQTWATNSGNVTASNMASAPVRIVPDPTFDCPDVIGKVFDDKNANGYQDQGEPGIPNVRLATVRGLLVTTDAQGRFHVPCPEIPNEDRGSNFVMKLDDRTLPSGYRLTTENPRDVRITAGKLVKLNFGATIHRVIRIELTDAAFETGKDSLLPDWQKQIDALPRQLTDKPSLVRLAYPPGADDGLRQQRIKALKAQLQKRWQDLNCCYTLVIETEGEGAQ